MSLPVSSPVSYDAAVRFLRQSTLGPTPALIAHVQSVGYHAFLNEQFAGTPSQYTFSQWWFETRDSVLRN